MKTIKFLLLLLAVSCFILSSSAQNELAINSTAELNPSKKGKKLTAAPTFYGGNVELSKYFNNHLAYPEIAKKQGIEGKILVEFTITDKGVIQEIELLNSLSEDLDKEALRLVRNMPDWQPAYQDGKARQVKYQLPILFKLDK